MISFSGYREPVFTKMYVQKKFPRCHNSYERGSQRKQGRLIFGKPPTSSVDWVAPHHFGPFIFAQGLSIFLGALSEKSRQGRSGIILNQGPQVVGPEF